MATLRDELLEMTPTQLRDTLHRRGRDKQYVSTVVGVFQDFKELRAGVVSQLPQPGPFQPRFQAAGDDEMASIKVPLPAPPDPTTLAEEDRPVKRKVTASVSGVEVFSQEVEDLAQAEFSIPITQGPTEATVDVGQSFADAAGNWSVPTVAPCTVPALPPVKVPDTTPPAGPAAFTPEFVPDATA